jgi:ABC-2 type transport system ATP-binding protein
MARIEVTDLRKSYGQTEALRGVSFSVEGGEVVGFLGPNGAGKTTTMKILTGFITQTSGVATVDGLDTLTESLEVRRRLGYLPENAPVYRDMLVRDYLRFICEVRQVPTSQREGRIDDTAARVGLGGVIHRPIGELSKGYRQRVGLAQALVHDPPILIMDEPTTGLDPNQIVEIRELIRGIGREKTILLSTHILPEVQAVCGRVLIVNRGQIVAFGTPAELEAQASGASRIHVTVGGTADAAATLRAVPGVLTVDAAPGEGPGTAGHVLTVPHGTDPRPELVHAVLREGWTVLELRREAGNLEGVFRSLTGG